MFTDNLIVIYVNAIIQKGIEGTEDVETLINELSISKEDYLFITDAVFSVFREEIINEGIDFGFKRQIDTCLLMDEIELFHRFESGAVSNDDTWDSQNVAIDILG